MGFFDNIKKAVQNAANDLQAAQAQADAMDLDALCNVLKDLKKLDPKMLAYKGVLQEKCDAMSDEELEQFYAYIKKQGGILKTHPGQKTVEDVLVRKNLYTRDEDGTLTKNSSFRFFK